MKILALSGSLRAASLNSALLRVAAKLAAKEMEIKISANIGLLPLFNPDLDSTAPRTVADFRQEVAEADALIIASPEYAHGITGVMKNALDWLVSFEPFMHKPVAIFNASPRAHHADAALREVLGTMSAVIVEPASVALPILGANLDAYGIESTPSIATSIQRALNELRIYVGLSAAH